MTLYTAGHLHTAVPHCSHSRAPIVHTAVPRENNEHGCVYLRCTAVCKLPGCVEGHPWSGGWFNKKMTSYQYRKLHCADKTISRLSYLHNGISHTGKMTSLYWILNQGPGGHLNIKMSSYQYRDSHTQHWEGAQVSFQGQSVMDFTAGISSSVMTIHSMCHAGLT